MSKLWSIEDVSEYLGVPVKTLYGWRTKRYGPPGKRVGRYIRYRPEDVAAWLDSITV
jgi:DNA-binding transcriptional MerR regulator